MSVHYDYYNSDGMNRTFEPNWHKDSGCQHWPLSKIPHKVILDELHLMLRVTDWLEQGLSLEVIDWDEVCDCSLTMFSKCLLVYATNILRSNEPKLRHLINFFSHFVENINSKRKLKQNFFFLGHEKA